MDQLLTDIRFGLRTIRRHRGFSTVAITVLALGIGATTAIFSIVNAVLLRPLPYKDPSQLVAVSSLYRRDGASRSFPNVSLNEVEGWRSGSQSFESVGSFVFSALPVNIGAQAMFLVAIGADAELLDTLGVSPAIGRNFSNRGSRSKENAVIISDRIWSEGFQRDPNVVGRSLNLDGTLSTIVGVLPQSFQFPRSDASYFAEAPDVIYPVANIADSWGRGSTQWFAIGRLKRGVSPGAAAAELRTITANMASSDAGLTGMSVAIGRLDAETRSSVRTPLLLTLAISLVLLLIACSNIMNLLFSQAAEREREMAVRRALGASAMRLVRQTLTESACLTILAGAVGVVLARFVLGALVRLSPAHLPISGQVEIDRSVLLFSFFVCVITAIFAGSLPGLYRSKGQLPSGTRSSANTALLSFQRTIMVGQIALGVGLLAAAGLLAHSLFRLSSVNPGFRVQDAVAFEVSFPSGRPAEAQQHYRRILEATRNVPGVISAGWITNPPPETRAGVFIPFSIPDASSEKRFCNLQITSEDYFQSAGIALTRGRDFTSADRDGAPEVALINETLAKQYFVNSDPLGRQIGLMWEGNKKRQIVGIVQDTHDRGLAAKAVATIYVPYGQFALAYGGVVARTSGSPQAVIPEIRRQLSLAEPTVPVRNLTTVAGRLG